jgi:hypothetical protein
MPDQGSSAPKAEALVEDVGEVEANLTAHAAAGLHIDPLDLARGYVGVREIPADNRVPLRLERARQIEPQAVGEPSDVVMRFMPPMRTNVQYSPCLVTSASPCVVSTSQ